MSVLLVIYRELLWLLPRQFRERHGSEMEIVFRDAISRSAGRVERIGCALMAFGDVVRQAAVARLSHGRDGHGRRKQESNGGGGMMGDKMLQDLRYGMRALRRRPGFTLVAVITLALGIGANTAIFSVLNSVLLRPLPYPAADRIGIIWHDLGNGAQTLPALNALDYLDYREWTEVFEEFTVATGRQRILSSDAGEPEIVDVGMIAASFLPFFGVEPVVGRGIRPEEDVPGGPAVAVLSHRLWSRRYGADEDMVGSMIDVDGQPHEVIGVLPASFELLLPAEAFLLRNAEVWVPVQIDVEDLPPRNFTGFTVFGRIQPGATWQQAQADMDRMETRLREEHAVHEASSLQVRVVPLHFDVVKQARQGLWVLFVAVGFVLLIACANVANLLLARGRSRERELSLRIALGASRKSVSRLILMESLILSAAGAVLGIALASVGLSLLVRYAAQSVPRLESVGVDATVLGFMVLVSVGSAMVLGLAPAFQGARANPGRTLNEAGRSGTGRRGGRLRNGLIVAEVALSVVLLIGAGLMMRSFIALQDVAPGFDPDGLLTFRVSLPPAQFPSGVETGVFYDQLEERLGALPGVDAVTGVSLLPLTGSGPLQPYAYNEETARNWESVTADERRVRSGFFQTMGATMLAGRDFTPQEVLTRARVRVIDQTLAERAFPNQDPIGQRLQVSRDSGDPDSYAEIIGVVQNVRLHDLTKDVLSQIFEPLQGARTFSVAVRTSGDPSALVPLVRREIRALGEGVAVEEMREMSDLVSGAMAQSRLSLSLMGTFAVIALVLSAVGLYGVISYAVGQRTHEIGVRMALGEAPDRIRRAILGQGVGLVSIALVLGIAGAAVLGRFVASLLYAVDPIDIGTYAIVTGLLGGVAILACWLPARHATRVNPIIALKSD